MAPPRVMLVEDDASVRRFVQMALEDAELELVVCENVALALAALARAPVDLLLTDIMMPGASGIDLLRRLHEEPGLRGRARLVVFSAGLTSEARQAMAPLGVWRVLEKPASLATLLDCVNAALGAGADAADAPEPQAEMPAGDADEAADAMEKYFAGNVELFNAYRKTCLEQFPLDVREGDGAAEALNLPHLMRVAHSLKTVTRTLGYPSLAAMARRIEHGSRDGHGAQALDDWALLRSGLLELAARE